MKRTLHPGHTGILHVSAVVDPALELDDMEDAHRVLVGEDDRLGNVDQVAALMAGGYDGPISYECFSPETQRLADPKAEIGRAFDFIETQIRAEV